MLMDGHQADIGTGIDDLWWSNGTQAQNSI